jgi:hypothetical protein
MCCKRLKRPLLPEKRNAPPNFVPPMYLPANRAMLAEADSSAH